MTSDTAAATSAPRRGAWKVALARSIYRAAWWVIAPVAVLRLLWRSRHEPGYRQHIGERFGFVRRIDVAQGDPLEGAPRVWVHAVSVGETRAAQPLIEALLGGDPPARVLLTHMTPGGRQTGEALFGARVERCYLPYDMPGAVRRFLHRQRPDVCALMETEVWPTLLAESRRAGVPVALVNARMSERSYRRAARFGVAAQAVFAAFSRVLAQSAADASRLTALGASVVEVVGNLKFDSEPPAYLLNRGRAWRERIGPRAVLVAASTREGEEGAVLDAFAALRKQPGCEQVLLLLVPRHPQRFDEVQRLAEQRRWRVVRRSVVFEDSGGDGAAVAAASGASTALDDTNAANAAIDQLAAADVLLGDSMGEMAAYFSAADVAFIGGSLVPLGGQNLIEACAIGVPVLVGPHTFNFTQASDLAIAAGGALRVANAAELASSAATLLTDAVRRQAMGAAALDFAAAHRGATRRIQAALRELWTAGTALD
ncbi:MAG: lipid IV(A) 3-deoxy-D-manno-octulosonic acid transferase [Janthinobacterium lividum]